MSSETTVKGQFERSHVLLYVLMSIDRCQQKIWSADQMNTFSLGAKAESHKMVILSVEVSAAGETIVCVVPNHNVWYFIYEVISICHITYCNPLNMRGSTEDYLNVETQSKLYLYLQKTLKSAAFQHFVQMHITLKKNYVEQEEALTREGHCSSSTCLTTFNSSLCRTDTGRFSCKALQQFILSVDCIVFSVGSGWT